MASAVLGKVSPTPKGEYVSTQDYDRLDVVTYEGYPYLAKSNVPSGNLPTDELYWMPLLTGLDFAPGGYGLGEAGGKTTTDYNTCILGGVYNGNNAVNGPTFIANAPYANVVVSRGASRIYQTMYCLGKIAHRHSNNGGNTWEEWVDLSPSAFAPAGYGYGGGVPYVTVSNYQDEASYNTALDDLLSGMPEGVAKQIRIPYLDGTTALGTVFKHYSGYATVVCYGYGGYSGGFGFIARKTKYNGSWSNWEYENPPMELGVEYRTTERWWGHPVYKKIVSVGKLPSATEATVSGVLTGVQDIISYSMTYASSGQGFINNSLVTELGRDESLSAWVKIKTTTNLSGYNGFLTLAYTKMEG